MAIIPSSLVQICRGLINDIDSSNYTYTDSKLEEIIAIAAFFVVQEVDFPTDYTIDVELQTITPSPSSDVDFLALVALKAACIILHGEYIVDSTKAMSVRDGPSSIDTRNRADHKRIISEDACNRYEQEKAMYVAGNYSPGKAIVSPYNLEDYGVKSYFS